MNVIKTGILGVCLACCAITISCANKRTTLADPPAAPELWVWLHSQINTPAELLASQTMIEHAHSLGYNGIAFWDVSFTYITSPHWPDQQGHYLRQAMDYTLAKGMKVLALGVPFGYSNDALSFNPNRAEGMRVSGTRFEVEKSGRKLRPISSFSGLENPGFESGKTGWFHTWTDQGTGVDSVVSHSGVSSGKIAGARGNARFSQLLKVTPWHQYHIRLFVKSLNYSGEPPVVEVLAANQQSIRTYRQIKMSATQDWTQVDVAFNSQSSSSVWLYFGVWGGNQGSLWFDDVMLEETALVDLIRRAGAPLKVYDSTTGTVFRESLDYDPVSDPLLTSDPHDDYHVPPEVTLPATTTMKPGQKVAIDYYAAQPVDSRRLGLCLTDPDVNSWSYETARRVLAATPAEAGIFLQYDEMRQMNSCATCRAKGLSAGDLLAWHVGQTIKLYRSLRPGAAVYVWNDMFDPYANAHDNYYLVEGDIAGSWRGLPSDVTIMNWNLEHLKDSLTWFSGENRKQPVPHRQIIAGYYDNHDGALAAASELQQAHAIPGIDGMMYTTWESDYSQLQAFSESATRNWGAYRASVLAQADMLKK